MNIYCTIIDDRMICYFLIKSMTSRGYIRIILGTLRTSDHSIKPVGKDGNSYHLSREMTLYEATVAPITGNLEKLKRCQRSTVVK